ncbi:MAG TPA: universal stress protein, partial [Longimicrobiales bacterium]
MFQNILLPLDGSHFSELALPLAIQVAHNSGAHLHIVRVHVPQVAEAGACVPTNYDQLLRDWEGDALEVALTRAQHARANATTEMLDGPVVPALLQYIKAKRIDLIIMTTHGRSGIRRAVLGSTAEECVRRTTLPMLLLRPREITEAVTSKVSQVRRILVALDGTDESEAVLPHAITLARMADADMVLARIAVAPFEVAVTIGAESLRAYVNQLREQAEEYLTSIAAQVPSAIPVRCITISDDRAADGILKLACTEEADLIAMA